MIRYAAADVEHLVSAHDGLVALMDDSKLEHSLCLSTQRALEARVTKSTPKAHRSAMTKS
jgi:ribonuclease D